MAEFQWWLLLVGLVAGGGLVAVVSMDGRRREQDVEGIERRAEVNWIVERMADTAQWIEADAVESVLRLHRDYLGMPPPDAILVDGEDRGRVDLERDDLGVGELEGDPDDVADEIRDDRRRRADEDLARPREQQAPAGQEADPGADGEQRADR